MKLLNYIKSLLPWIKKDDILENVRVTLGSLENFVKPSYADVIKHMPKYKSISPPVKDLTAKFFRMLDNRELASRGTSIIEVIHAAVPNIIANTKELGILAEDLLEQDVITESLTAKKSVVIRGTEQITFIAEYALSLLDYILMTEATANDSDEEAKDIYQYPPVKEKEIKDGILMFAKLVGIYGQSPSEFKHKIDGIPDIRVTADAAGALKAVYREDKIDPFSEGMAESGLIHEGIYHLGLYFAERHARSYKAMKEKKKMLELRILDLQALVEGSPNPKIEKELEYLKGRVERMEYDIRKEEESVA